MIVVRFPLFTGFHRFQSVLSNQPPLSGERPEMCGGRVEPIAVLLMKLREDCGDVQGAKSPHGQEDEKNGQKCTMVAWN